MHPPQSMAEAATPSRRPGEPFWLALIAGFSLALGYGLVARVLQRTTASPKLGLDFPERKIPGTSLQALRRQHASGDAPLPANLGALSLEALEKSRAEQGRKEAAEAEKQAAEAKERQRLEETEEPAPLAPALPAADLPRPEPLPEWESDPDPWTPPAEEGSPQVPGDEREPATEIQDSEAEPEASTESLPSPLPDVQPFPEQTAPPPPAPEMLLLWPLWPLPHPRWIPPSSS